MQIVSQVIVQQLLKIPVDILTASIGVVLLLSIYAILRVMRTPGRFIAWSMVLLLIAASVLACVFGFIRNDSLFSNNGLLGLIAFLVAVYAGSQWLARRWYLWIKRHGRSLLAKATQRILRFLRAYHQLFGWLVLLAATGHALSYGPTFARMKMSDVATGVIVWFVLALLVLWGYGIERRRKQKRSV
ncbi:MAG TPA: hypothetical protein VGN34_34570 [Ktedonobacteraceae bacterium]|jgi:hypothetical protein